MKSLYLELVCETDIAITKKSATLGGHETLLYIPGRALLGACARAIYRELEEESPELSYRVFHSGEVRFGDGLPCGIFDEPAYPVPRALHVPKGKDATHPLGGYKRFTDHVCNLVVQDPEPTVQYKQRRTDFVNSAGYIVTLETRTSLRTAIEPSTGRARDGLLYELSVLTAGSRFFARVDADDAALLERVRSAFEAHPIIFLGRSRSSELGRVRVVRREAWPRLPSQRAAAPTHRAVFWCLSDLALRDPTTAQPTFTPSPVAFGLPDGFELDRKRSYLRTRRYSPFNGTRQRPDLERQVIEAGSVLVFGSADGAECDPLAVEQAVARGVGLYRQDGLGQVCYAPRCLAEERPRFDTPPAMRRAAEPAPASLSEPSGALRGWLERQARDEALFDNAWKKAEALAQSVVAVRAWRKLPASQWGEVARIARLSRTGDLLGNLQRFVDEGVRATTRAWGAKGKGNTTLAEWLLLKVTCLLADPASKEALGARGAAMAIELLAKRVVRLARTPTRPHPHDKTRPEREEVKT